MSYKRLPRLGSAIASTILSLFSGVLLVGVDKAQAAVLTYNFQAEYGGGGFFKVDNSSLTGIGLEQVAVSEGILNTILILNFYALQGGKQYYDLAGARALFYQGDFRGLQTGGGDSVTSEIIIPPDEPYGPFYLKFQGRASWSIETIGEAPMRISYFYGYREVYSTDSDGTVRLADRAIVRENPVSYTLVNTEAEPVPEPLTAGGTALALAGLSWLKQKKKMAA